MVDRRSFIGTSTLGTAAIVFDGPLTKLFAQVRAGTPGATAAWVAFARTGNPNHKGLPNWPPFSANERPTMIFNNECRVVNDPYREERLAMNALQPARPSL